MASFEIKTPDGQTFQIDGPENITQAEIMNQLTRLGITGAQPGQPRPGGRGLEAQQQFAPPQTLGSAALEAAREPARVARRGFQELGALLPETGQTRSAALNVAIGAPRSALETVGEAAAGFIEPEALALGGAGRVLGAGAKAIGRGVQAAKGPFATAAKTPSVLSKRSNQRAFRSLEKLKRRLFRDTLPEQLDKARRITKATPQTREKFLQSVEGLLKDPTASQQIDSATLFAAREIAGKSQAAGGGFAGLARATKRKISRLLEQRAPGLSKAFSRVEDIFQASGEPGRAISLLDALSPSRVAQTATLPGVQRLLGASAGIAGRAIGLPLQRGGTLGAIAGSQLREGQ